MSHKSEWQALKAALSREGYQTSVFDQDFSNALDRLSAAEKAYDTDRNAATKQARHDAAQPAIAIGAYYERAVRVAADSPIGQVSAGLKQAAGNADGWFVTRIRTWSAY